MDCNIPVVIFGLLQYPPAATLSMGREGTKFSISPKSITRVDLIVERDLNSLDNVVLPVLGRRRNINLDGSMAVHNLAVSLSLSLLRV